jgi:hypothetical protein
MPEPTDCCCVFLCSHLPLQVDVKDTVGCGDSFAAAIVLGYTRTHDVHATLLLANAVGAATATGRGAGTNVADAKTVHELLQQAAAACNGNGVQRHDLEKALHILHDSLSSAELMHLINTSSSGSSSQQKTPAAHAA